MKASSIIFIFAAAAAVLFGLWYFNSGTTVPVIGDDDMVMCTQEALECPDGSYVGRTGPNCEFAACPNGESPLPPQVVNSSEIVCTPDMKQAEACIEIYAPVCASVQVACVTTPCEPIKETYANSCFACIEDRVLSYTEGACI